MTKREKVLLVIAIILLFFLFGLKQLILPGIDNLLNITKQLKSTSHQLNKASLSLESSEKYLSKLTEINIELKLMENVFYNGNLSDIRLKVLNFLDGQINNLGFDIESKELIIESSKDSSVEQDDKNSGKEPGKILYRAQLKGDYQQLSTLLENINRYHKYYSISQLDLKNSNGNQLSIFIVIESYCIEGDEDDKKEV